LLMPTQTSQPMGMEIAPVDLPLAAVTGGRFHERVGVHRATLEIRNEDVEPFASSHTLRVVSEVVDCKCGEQITRSKRCEGSGTKPETRDGSRRRGDSGGSQGATLGNTARACCVYWIL